MESKDLGLLIDPENLKIQRDNFLQMCELLGINAIYRQCKAGKTWDGYGELDTAYEEPIVVPCMYNENVDQKTMKKLGWNAELNDSVTLISVPYDTPNIQVGCLFILPSGIDEAQGRVFRVIRMATIAVYPSSITCELAPVWKNKTPRSEIKDFGTTNFNVLNNPEDVENT